MTGVHSHEPTPDEEEDPEETVRIVEGHAVRFNEYRY